MALLSASGMLLFAHQLTAIKMGRLLQGRHIKINTQPIMKQKSFFSPRGQLVSNTCLSCQKIVCPIVISRNVNFSFQKKKACNIKHHTISHKEYATIYIQYIDQHVEITIIHATEYFSLYQRNAEVSNQIGQKFIYFLSLQLCQQCQLQFKPYSRFIFVCSF